MQLKETIRFLEYLGITLFVKVLETVRKRAAPDSDAQCTSHGNVNLKVVHLRKSPLQKKRIKPEKKGIHSNMK